MSVAVDTVAAHEQLSTVGHLAADKFRKMAQDTGNPITKELAEGLAHLAESIREMDAK